MNSASAAVVYDELFSVEPDPDQKEPVEEDLVYSDDEPNLVPVFQRSEKGKEALRRIADRIRGEFSEAWDASADYRKRWAADWKLLAGELPPKDDEFKYCANANIPISLENVSRIATRLFGELFHDFKNPCQFVSLTAEDRTADAMTKHTNWQFRTQIPDFKRQMHRACMAFVHIGDWVCHSYYDSERQQNRHEVLTPDEFVMPWTQQTTMPDLSDLPWYAKICAFHRHQLQARKSEWADVEWVLQNFAPTFDDEPDQEVAEQVTKDQGHDKNDGTKWAPFKVLWWEGWLDLPSRPKQHFVRLHLHLASGRILHMMVNEEADWQDSQRYELEMQQYQGYRQERESWELQRAQVENTFDRADDYLDTVADEGLAGGEPALMGMMQVDQQRQAQLQQIDAMEPQRPGWMSDDGAQPERPRRTPVYMFTHAVCLEPLVGNRGLSYGRIQGDLQRAVNAIVSQYIDAGTFGNIRSFIATPDAELQGDLVLKPGKINYTKTMSSQDITKAIMPIQTGQANPQLMEVADLLVQNAQRSMQASDILSGEPGKSGETYKGVAARIEQATKQLSVLGRKMGDAVALIAKNNARLNSIFLRDEELVRIADMKDSQPFAIGRNMYRQNYAVEITSDMRFATNVQKVAEADELVQMVMGFSQPGGPLMGNLAMQHAVIADSFKARQRDDLVRMMGAPPPPPPQFGPPPPPMPPPGMEGAPPGGGQGAPPQGGPPQ